MLARETANWMSEYWIACRRQCKYYNYYQIHVVDDQFPPALLHLEPIRSSTLKVRFWSLIVNPYDNELYAGASLGI